MLSLILKLSFFLILVLWLVSLPYILKNFLENIQYWQVKEYRLDRVIAALKYSNSRNILIEKFLVIFIGASFIYTFLLNYFFVYPDCSSAKLSLLTFTLSCLLIPPLMIHYSYRSILTLKLILKHKVLYPSLSTRNLLILAFLILLLLLFLIFDVKLFLELQALKDRWIPYYHLNSIDLSYYNVFTYQTTTITSWEQLLFVNSTLIILFDILSFAIVGVGVLLTSPLAWIRRWSIVAKAKEKLKKYPKLITIGITGSFGKTTTKEILVKILSEKYKVAYTPENKNTDVGIAMSILSSVDESTEIFIAEMGAYCKGEIKRATDLLPLDFAIVTIVGNSHLDIFGSVRNIAKAKFEIVEGLKPDGVAILNADNKYTAEMKLKTKNKSIMFSYENKNDKEILQITDEKWTDEKVEFNLNYKNIQEKLSAKVIGNHIFKNLAPALACAFKLGFSAKEIKTTLEKITIESPHFKVAKSEIKKIVIIDDSYNSNSDGFSGALNFMQNFQSQDKILITKGIVEVGKDLEKIYTKLSEEIISTTTMSIIADRSLYDAVKNSQTNDRITQVKYCETNEEILNAIELIPKENCVILIEGRIHPDAMKLIYNLI